MIGKTSNIATGVATSGDVSAWHMKLSEASSGLTIASGFDTNHVIPATRTSVASRASGTSVAAGDTVKISYSAFISQTQVPDTYTGKVKYILFHPSTATANDMQNFPCDSLNEGQTVTLTDKRDNNPYTVAKLKDGKCWMVDNLRLGLVDKTTKLTPADSDVSADYTLPASNTSAFNGSGNDAAYVGELGGYYPWKVATAGTGTAAVAAGSSAPSSICPKGWRLPTGGDANSDIGKLITAYGGATAAGVTALRNTPLPGFTAAGYIHGSTGALTRPTTFSGHWSSTAASSSTSYYLRLEAPSDIKNYPETRLYGLSVRCVTR